MTGFSKPLPLYRFNFDDHNSLQTLIYFNERLQGEVMINVSDENLISLSEATRLFPRRRRGKKPHVSSLYRYATIGYRGIRLEVLRCASTLCTSSEAVQRFLERMTEADEKLNSDEGQAAPVQAVETAEIERTLDELGFGESPTSSRSGGTDSC